MTETATELSLGKAIARDVVINFAATAGVMAAFVAFGFAVEKIQNRRAKKTATEK